MPVGFPTKVNYATGDVLSATNMNDLSGTVNLLQGSQFAAGKNKIFNSDFSIWQRGTSFTALSTAIYTADRWGAYSGTTGRTVSRQNSGTGGPNAQYCARIARDSGNTNTSIIYFYQSLESSLVLNYLVNASVTLSFWARSGANYSAASNILTVELLSGTGTDQNIISGYTGVATVIGQNQTLTTTWTRYSWTGTVPLTATELGIRLSFQPTGTAGAADYFEISGVQLENSTQMSVFQTATGNPQGELAACQRYYYRQGTDSIYQGFGLGIANSTTLASIQVVYPVQMRVNPSSLDYSTTALYSSSAITAVTNLVIDVNAISKNSARLNATVASGLTVDRPYYLLANNSTSAFVGFNAEL